MRISSLSLAATLGFTLSLSVFAGTPARTGADYFSTPSPHGTNLPGTKSATRPHTKGLIAPVHARTESTTIVPLTWHWANPQPSGDQFQAVAYGGGVYVAVGGGEVIYTSTTGTSWTQVQASLANGSALYDVIYTGSNFEAVGISFDSSGNPINIALQSTNGSSWTSSTIGPQNGVDFNLDGLAYGNGTYVEVNTGAATSTDGKTWTTHNIGSLNPATSSVFFDAPVFGNNNFVTLGVDNNSGAYSVYYSSDNGNTWTQSTIGVPTGDFLGSMAYNGSTFVIVGRDNSGSCGTACGLLFTSTDGITWTQQTDVADDGKTDGFDSALVWNGTDFVDDDYTNVLTSADGIHWTTGASISGQSFISPVAGHAQIWSGSLYVSARNGTLALQSSPSFASWTASSQATGPNYHWHDVIFANNLYIAAGFLEATLGGAIATSPDGITWTVRSTTSVDMTSVATNGSLIVAAGGTILTSSNGTTWATATTPPPASDYFVDVTYGNGEFVAVGFKGVIYTSPDGQTWTQATTATADDLGSVVWTGSHFVAASACSSLSTDGNSLFTSADGHTWSTLTLTQPTSAVYLFCRLRTAGTQVVAIGGEYSYSGTLPTGTVGNIKGAAIGTSPDGTTWTTSAFLNTAQFTISQFAPITDILFLNSNYVALQSGALYTSTDLANWNLVLNDPYAVLGPIAVTLASSGSSIVVAGTDGDILSAALTVPTASNGTLSCTEGLACTGTFPTTALGDTYAISSQGTSGTITVTNPATGGFTYTPTNADFVGSDSFAYTVKNFAGQSLAGTISVSMALGPPVATSQSISVTENKAYSGTLSVTGGTGSFTFTITTSPTNGTLPSIDNMGNFTYTPNSNFTGTDTFTYTVSNSVGQSSATVSIKVSSSGCTACKILGGAGAGAFDLLCLLLLAGVGCLRRYLRR